MGLFSRQIVPHRTAPGRRKPEDERRVIFPKQGYAMGVQGVRRGIVVPLSSKRIHLTEAVVPGGTALVVTALTSNPFYGVLAGEAMVYVKSLGVVDIGT
jgi:hypothetical protein